MFDDACTFWHEDEIGSSKKEEGLLRYHFTHLRHLQDRMSCMD